MNFRNSFSILIFYIIQFTSAFWHSAEFNVRFYLFTNENPVVGQCMACNLQATKFNPERPTKILIHGFGQNATSNFNRDLKNAFLAQGDFNVIVVDWSQSAGCLYQLASYKIHGVGYSVGNFLDGLNTNNANIHIVGYDYGAHIASTASKCSARGRVGRITGLDPAATGVHVNDPNGRLNKGDATFVEVFHSNSGNLGIGIPIGNTDFYINDGIKQPGCTTPTCSHYQSVEIFWKLLANPAQFGIQSCQYVNQQTFACSGDDIEYSERTPDGVYTINTQSSQAELIDDSGIETFD